MKKALVPLADGFEDIEAVSVIDVLRRGGVEVVTAALADTRFVRSAHGIRLEADALLADVIDQPYDAIVLPGGGEGTDHLRACESLAARLRRQKADGGLVCAICAAPTVLEAAEVLEDEDVTCYPSCAAQMGRPVKSVPVVVDGQIITGRGPGMAMLFALVVLMHLVGERPAHGVANGLLTELM
jgi:4-methyl-5(b-hydroxyethyl)-thiazole monophosphate biosynthesis